MSEITKVCSKCYIDQPLSCFSKNNFGKYGCRSVCKQCDKKYHHTNYIKNKDKIDKQNKEYYESNKDAVKVRAKQWYIANKKRLNAQNKQWYSKNKPKVILRQKNYRVENKTVISIRESKYHSKNKTRINARHSAYFQTPIGRAVRINTKHKRRSIEKQGDVTSQQILRLQQNATHCFWCELPLNDKKVHIDHFYPLSKGGKHSLSNLVVACSKCNITKGAKDPFEFAEQISKKL